jgi:nucleolar MIF4G domain-containing protein 1
VRASPPALTAGSGPQLRSEDPASLKDIVAIVQDKTKGKEKEMT